MPVGRLHDRVLAGGRGHADRSGFAHSLPPIEPEVPPICVRLGVFPRSNAALCGCELAEAGGASLRGPPMQAEGGPMRVEVHVHRWRGRGTRRFVRHLLEMTVAMAARDGRPRVALFPRSPRLGVRRWFRVVRGTCHTELAVFAMTFNMTLPMVALMRYRGHSWERCGEMAGAMFVLALAVLVSVLAGRAFRQRRAPIGDGVDAPGHDPRDALPRR